MPAWHRLKTLWRNLARKRMVEEDLDDEIRSYREILEDEKVRTGDDPRAASQTLCNEIPLPRSSQ